MKSQGTPKVLTIQENKCHYIKLLRPFTLNLKCQTVGGTKGKVRGSTKTDSSWRTMNDCTKCLGNPSNSCRVWTKIIGPPADRSTTSYMIEACSWCESYKAALTKRTWKGRKVWSVGFALAALITLPLGQTQVSWLSLAPCLASLGGTVFNFNQCVSGFSGMIHHITSYKRSTASGSLWQNMPHP